MEHNQIHLKNTNLPKCFQIQLNKIAFVIVVKHARSSKCKIFVNELIKLSNLNCTNNCQMPHKNPLYIFHLNDTNTMLMY